MQTVEGNRRYEHIVGVNPLKEGILTKKEECKELIVLRIIHQLKLGAALQSPSCKRIVLQTIDWNNKLYTKKISKIERQNIFSGKFASLR